jgi:hypothetical protein
LLLFGGGGATAQGGEPIAALRAVERGQWQLRLAGGGVRRLCVGNPRALLQVQHKTARCQIVVMDNGASTATVRYTCPGHGQGRTTLTVETSKLISLDTQGVIDGAPFSETYEGRLLGPC